MTGEEKNRKREMLVNRKTFESIDITNFKEGLANAMRVEMQNNNNGSSRSISFDHLDDNNFIDELVFIIFKRLNILESKVDNLRIEMKTEGKKTARPLTDNELLKYILDWKMT